MDNTIRVEDELEDAVNRKDLRAASRTLTQMSPHDVVGVIERSSLRRAAVIFRLLSKERALQFFDGLGHTMQSELFRGLRDEDVAATIRVDPAVFSTPFITTFCDATGLLIYFTIAKAILGV
nr:magnesium transporter [Glaciibacter superstes]